MSRCTKAFIYQKNLQNNILQIKKLLNSETKLCLAVKADGYGHNAVLAAKIAENCGVHSLAIATVDEGIELRENGITLPLLLLSLCTPCEMEDLFKYNITPFVFSKEYIQEIVECGKKIYKNSEIREKFPVHLAVDTGMGRVGCYPHEAGIQAKMIEDSGILTLGGMATHFAVSDSLLEENQKFTEEQYKKFCDAVDNVKKEGIKTGICSCSNSAAILNNSKMHFDMVRAGIIAYGYYPDEITKSYLLQKGIDVDLKPVMSFETEVVAIRHFPKGKSVSYGRTWHCDKDTDIAVLPVGYADGLLRRFSPGLEVTINGKKYPVVGRICMDQCMVDIGKDNKDVHLWDKVLIFGPKESGALTTADDLAKVGNTISYEVLTSLSKRVTRYIK